MRDPLLIFGIGGILGFAVLLIGVAHMGWRVLRGNEEPQQGGSMSRQMFRRYDR